MDPTLLIGDIVERDTRDVKSPQAFDDIESTTTGFPSHKKRPRVSAFKRQQQGKADDDAAAKAGIEARKAHDARNEPDSDAQAESFEAAEKRKIDRENRLKMEDMSAEEIEKERAELFQGLNPTLIQRLLRRANIDDEHDGPDPFKADPRTQAHDSPVPKIKVDDTARSAPEPHTHAEPTKPTGTDAGAEAIPPKSVPPVDEHATPAAPPDDLFPITEQPTHTHFPVPPSLPDLDPSHPDFLSTLHEKFFPNLPTDPSKLAWMAPIPTADSTADRESPYYPGQESLPISALRFDFRGALLPPRLSRTIPVSKGLHHHGLAPEAAGYTIEELAILARSAVAAQRCIAFQTLGRILYRLGKGEWGKNEEDSMARGIWSSIVEGRVLESLGEAATKDSGHRGSRAYATEALWLFDKGGWKSSFTGR